MNIQPTSQAIFGGLAGTGRVAATSADADQRSASVAQQQRSQDASGRVDGLAEIEKDAASGDSDGDGRQMYQRQQSAESKEDASTSSDDQPRRRSANTASGQHLDLDA